MSDLVRRDFLKGLALAGAAATTARADARWFEGLPSPLPPPNFSRYHTSITTFTDPLELDRLVRLIKQYAIPDIVSQHYLMNGAHGGFREQQFLGFAVIPGEGERFFTWHREYLAPLEKFLRNNGWNKGLPSWAPWEPIPPQFSFPADRSRIVPPPPPVLGKESFLKWSNEVIGCWRNADDMGFYLSWGPHFQVHFRCKGDMAVLDKAPAAPLFWLWHAFIDDIYERWRRDPKRCSKGVPWPQPSPRTPQNPLPGPNDPKTYTPWCLGVPLNVARDLIAAAGLRVCNQSGFANNTAPVISQQPLPTTEQVRGACVDLSGEVPPPGEPPRFPSF